MNAPTPALPYAGGEPIAVIGMACRFPGGCDTPEAYWSLLRSGRNAITEIPRERWDIEPYYDPDPNAPGKMYARHGAFIDQHPGLFDASFFGISPHEAWPMDPSHRLMLEVAWESLENAGIPPRSLAGSSTGVFAGVSDTEYLLEQFRVGTAKDLSAYHAYGTAAFGTGRISYTLGLEGPAVSIDTACSSSLVATLMAVDSLRAGTCRMALAGGSHLMLTPMATAVLCRMTALSLTGRSKVFDEEADGFVRGEGAGMVVLKRLGDAIDDGDRILAVIRGGSWNHDGRGTGLATPRGSAQEQVIDAALRSAGLAAEELGYVEAHGTGTPVGDPIEVTAIGNVLAVDRPEDAPLLLGSGKTNIGHLEAASGAAALMKVVLALQHREVPAHIGLDRPNPNIDWDRYGVEVPTASTPWPANGRSRVAGINSFGLSGTNSHLIVEEAPEEPPRPAADGSRMHLLPLSGGTEGAARDLAVRYGEALRTGNAEVRDFCHTAGVGRSHERRRLAVVGDTREALIEALEARARRAPGTSRASSAGQLDIAFLFTGQGAQYPQMGRKLFETSPVFRSTMEESDELLRPHLEIPLLDVLYGDAHADLIHRTDYTQPALLAIELALADVWASWGIRPTQVIGHSLGEYAAATVAGVFHREDALSLVATRGRMMQELTAGGSMAVIFAAEDLVRDTIDGLAVLSVAAINGPANTVISGTDASVSVALERLDGRGLTHQRLEVSHAFHSPLMDPMLDAFEAVVAGVDRSPPRIPLISNVTGDVADGDALTRPDYWRSHVRSPVRFADSVLALERSKVDAFLEIGPQPTLLGMAGLSLSGPVAMVPSLRRGQPDDRQMLDAAGQLYESGAALDWAALTAGEDARRVSIPFYPFQRKHHWYESEEGPRARFASAVPVRTVDAVDHPLLGTRLRSPELSGVTFQSLLEPTEPRYLGSYRLGRGHFVPLSAQVEMVQAGVREGLRWDDFELVDVDVGDPFGIPKGDGRVVQVSLTDPEQGTATFRIVSLARSGSGTPRWVTHLSGSAQRMGPEDKAPVPALEEARSHCATAVEVTSFYQSLKTDGLRLGKPFRTVHELHVGEGEVFARVALPDSLKHEAPAYGIHPALLESAFRLPSALTSQEEEGGLAPLMTTGVSRLRLTSRAGSMTWLHARLVTETDGSLVTHVTGWDDNGQVVSTFHGTAQHRSPLASVGRRVVAEDEWSLGVYWHEGRSSPPDLDAHGHWLVVGSGAGVGPSLVEGLRAAGGTVTHTVPDRTAGTVDRSGRKWATEMIEALEAEGVTRLRGVISCIGVYDDAEGSDSDQRLERAVGIASDTTDLVAELGRTAILEGPLLLLTRGSVSVGTGVGPACLESAAIWGLVPIIRAEYSGMATRVVDLDPAPGAPLVEQVFSELRETDREDRVARRDGVRLLPRLEPFHDTGPTRETLIRPDRAYLVTGGLGWIGRAVATWLAERGAGLIVLNARRAPNAETAEWIRALRDGGSRVEVMLGDVGEPGDVERLVAEVAATDYQLGGVFHAAGILWNGPIDDLTSERHRTLMDPKVRGTWNLHTQTLDQPIDLFVLFGSLGSLWGRPLQGAYAAANAYLPVFAAHRASRGLPVTCVEWGLWAGGGMASDVTDRAMDMFMAGGMELLEPRRAMSALEDHLREQTQRVVIASIDWGVSSEALAGLSVEPFLSNVIDDVERDVSNDTQSTRARLDELDALSLEDRTEQLIGVLTNHMAEVLGVDPEELPADVDVRLRGLDSLMALDLRHRLESDLGLTMPPPGAMGTLSPARVGAVLAELVPAAAQRVRAKADGAGTESVEGEI